MTRLRCSTQQRDRVRLGHILDAAAEARAFIHGVERDELDTNRQLEHSLTRLLEIIGEAATHLSAETREALSEVPWTRVIAMRNRLIHAYFNVNLDYLWDTVVRDLPPLESVIRAHLEENPGDDPDA